jgi:gamma-glutamyltranspeptidase/glutathione hydrolase/leukotriene-C4 hydrolase
MNILNTFIAFNNTHINRAIPGEIKGYEEAHKRFGKLPWRDLFQPSIDLCEKGFQVGSILAQVLENTENDIRKNKPLSDMFINPLTNRVYKKLDHIKCSKLAQTFRVIADRGANEFYNGSLTPIMVNEINQNGGNVSLEDFQNYKALVLEDRLAIRLNDELRLFVPPPPSSGIIIPTVLRIMSGFKFKSRSEMSKSELGLYYHRLTETFKHLFSKRAELGDERFVNLNQVKN